MRNVFLSEPGAVRTALEKLFDAKPPILVEVRFPKMGTSSDWFLCEDVAALDAILNRLGLGAEIHLNSVWDLKNPVGAVVIPKGERQSEVAPPQERPGVTVAPPSKCPDSIGHPAHTANARDI